MRRAALVAMLAVGSARQVDYRIGYCTKGKPTKFVPNGFCRIDSPDNRDILNVAFKDSSGSLVLIAYNDTATSQNFKFGCAQSRLLTLCRSTPRTFRWNVNEK